MLNALYDYGITHPDILSPLGCTERPLHWVICLGHAGEVLAIRKHEGKVICPNAGGKAKSVGNVCMEKASISLSMDPQLTGKKMDTICKKRVRFMERFMECGCPECLLVADLLTDDVKMKEIREEAQSLGVTHEQVVGFSVDGVLISELKSVRDWWADQCGSTVLEPTVLDLVTGDLCVPADTYKKISAPAAGGGQSSGCALISHNKEAFNSYGLSQNQNCPMSEKTAGIVMDALLALAKDAPRIDDLKFLNWYDCEVSRDNDVFVPFFGKLSTVELDEDAMKAEVDRMITSILSGEIPHSLDSHQYHILVTRPNAARLSIQYYDTGSYASLYQNLKSWYDGLTLERIDGRGYVSYPKFYGLIYSLLSSSEQKVKQGKFKPVCKLVVPLLYACIKGTLIPDAAAFRALCNIRSLIYNENKKNDHLFQFLKLWLCRKELLNKGGVYTMTELNGSHPEPAYHCGRIFAVYANLQETIAYDMNASIIERYYSACSQSPALTLGMLQRLANYYFGKLTSKRYHDLYQDALSSAYTALGDQIPKQLTMEQQAYFALGYQQQLGMLAKKKRAFSEKKGENDNECIEESV